MVKSLDSLRGHRGTTFLIAALFIALFFVLMGPGDATAEPDTGGTVVILMATGPPRTLNSAVATGYSAGIISAQLFASPLRYDDNWQPQPYLAEKWKMSEDGRSLTLNLVKGATFHDGHPTTSS